MIIQIHLSDNQLADYMKLIGYETRMETEIIWTNTTHSHCEPSEVMRLHVVLSDGSTKPAKEFFEKLIDETIINILKNNKNGKS